MSGTRDSGMGDLGATVKLRRKKRPQGENFPVIRSGSTIEPAADVLAGLSDDASYFGSSKVEADWLVHSGLRGALIRSDTELLERSLRRGADALDDPDSPFHPADEKGRRMTGDSVELVAALICLQRAWSTTHAVYRRGAAPLFVSSSGYLADNPPAHLTEAGAVTLDDPRKSPTTPRVLITHADWKVALSGYVHRLMTRQKVPKPRQFERELSKEGLTALDVAKAASYIIDGALNDLAALLEDDESKKLTADPAKYYKIIWNGHGPGPGDLIPDQEPDDS